MTSPVDEVHRILNCFCLRWATEDNAGQSVQFSPTMSDTVETGEWYGLVPFPSVQSVHQIARSNHSVGLFFPELPWPAHYFYVNRFKQDRQ